MLNPSATAPVQVTSSFELIDDGKLVGVVEFAEGETPDVLRGYVVPNTVQFYADFYKSAAPGLAPLREYQLGVIARFAGFTATDGKKPRILDIGAGTGQAVYQLRGEPYALDAYGIEPAVETSPDGVVVQARLDELGRQSLPQVYDTIMLLDVFEHFLDPDATLDALLQHLEPNGTLLLKLPNRRATIYQVSKHLRWILPRLSSRILGRLYQIKYPPPHYYYYDEPSIAAVLARRGLEVFRTTYISETPLALLWRRLWGFKPAVKPLIFAAVAGLKLLSLGKRQECFVVMARRVKR